MRMCRNHPILGIHAPYLFHVENERQCGYAAAATRKAMGVKAGVSDLLLLYPSRGYSGMVLELKAPGAHPTGPQELFLKAMEDVGYLSAWFDNALAAYRKLIWYVTVE